MTPDEIKKVEHLHAAGLSVQSDVGRLLSHIEEMQSRIDAAVARERERCALIIERHAEGSHGGKRILVPRHDGNLAGLGYAEAIRSPTPAPEEGR